MAIERIGMECESLDLDRGSSTRLRAVRPPSDENDENRSDALAVALLAGHERGLRRLSLRLDLQREGFVTSWLELAGCSTLLAQESTTYVESIRRNGKPLLESLARGRFELSEIHANELFFDLREASLGVQAALEVVAAFEDAALRRAAGAELSGTIRAVGRFLTCAAMSTFARQETSALAQSSERPLPRTSLKRAQLGCLVGNGRRMHELRAQLEDIATAPGAVLIVGESGTGKELVAKAIHELGEFSAEPFVAVNCAALPRELFESELFGHERGAFTGSRDSAPGLLRAAQRGSVFLDEITEMPAALQPKLLRALEQRAVRPIGGLRELPFHARVVAATNRDPERTGEPATLRPDLFYRLCVHRIDVPPLRERSEDIPALVSHFLEDLFKRGHKTPPGFSEESLCLLRGYSWPGNVRELRNVVEHSCATAKGARVEPRHLPARIKSAEARRDAPSVDAKGNELSLKGVERRHIEHVLAMTGGNKARAARLLGLSRHQLYLKLDRF